MKEYYLQEHSHQNHSHFFLSKTAPSKPKENVATQQPKPSRPTINRSDEGCPCCMQALDLDEISAVISKISQNSEKNSEDFFGVAEVSSPDHWGLFLGVAGPFALVGLTAAYRNIKGTINTRDKLQKVIDGLRQDIGDKKRELLEAAPENQEQLGQVIKRLEAFLETLSYSKFDTNFNLVVPGIINGAASSMVIGSAIIATPLALPLIALYAGCQTVKNGYDLWRVWNRILPEDIAQNLKLQMKVGIRKVNQITKSKRKFYAANGAGFAVFATGAAIATAVAAAPTFGAALPVGIGLLALGSVATAVTNNIWTAKFKPRNGAIGVDRTKVGCDEIIQEIGIRRELKKLLKNYKKLHIPENAGTNFAGSLLSSLPFLKTKGGKIIHNNNKARIDKSDSQIRDQIDLVSRMLNVRKLLSVTTNQAEADLVLKKVTNLEQVSKEEKKQFGLIDIDAQGSFVDLFQRCVEFGIDNFVLNRFIKNLTGSKSAHDTTIKTQEEYIEKLTDYIGEGKIFEIKQEEGSTQISFNPELVERDDRIKKIFMSSLEEYLLFDYIEKLKYEQYGLNDFYWALKKQEEKFDKAGNQEQSRTRVVDNLEAAVSEQSKVNSRTMPSTSISNPTYSYFAISDKDKIEICDQQDLSRDKLTVLRFENPRKNGFADNFLQEKVIKLLSNVLEKNSEIKKEDLENFITIMKNLSQQKIKSPQDSGSKVGFGAWKDTEEMKSEIEKFYDARVDKQELLETFNKISVLIQKESQSLKIFTGNQMPRANKKTPARSFRIAMILDFNYKDGSNNSKFAFPENSNQQCNHCL